MSRLSSRSREKTCNWCSRTALAVKICLSSTATRAAGTRTSRISSRCSKARRARRSGRCTPSSRPNTKNSRWRRSPESRSSQRHRDCLPGGGNRGCRSAPLRFTHECPALPLSPRTLAVAADLRPVRRLRHRPRRRTRPPPRKRRFRLAVFQGRCPGRATAGI